MDLLDHPLATLPIAISLAALLIFRVFRARAVLRGDLASTFVVGFARSEFTRMHLISQVGLVFVVLSVLLSLSKPRIDLSGRMSEAVIFIPGGFLADPDNRKAVASGLHDLHQRAPKARVGLLVGEQAMMRWFSEVEIDDPKNLDLYLADATRTADVRTQLESVVERASSSMTRWGVNRFLIILSNAKAEAGDFDHVKTLHRKMHLQIFAAQIGDEDEENPALASYWMVGGYFKGYNLPYLFNYVANKIRSYDFEWTPLAALFALVMTFVMGVHAEGWDQAIFIENKHALGRSLLSTKLRH